MTSPTMNIARPQHAMALSYVRKIGNRTYKNLVDTFGSPEAVLKTPLKELQDHTLTKNIANYIKTEGVDLMKKAQQNIPQYETAGISIIAYGDEKYPYRLKEIYDPPSLLYRLGEFDLNKKKMIAIVGTRKASDYGKKFVEQIIAQLSAYKDVVIVSGLAYGIDICAHRAALANGLSTVAVLATGLDTAYPLAHQQEVNEIAKQGCVLSEHPLGVKVEKYCFPVRNRIIAGLVDAVIVVEADQKSGALITAKHANDFNREVFAVPGNVTRAQSQGCHDLIKTHQAHIITSAQDLSYIMNWDTPKNSVENQRKIPKGLTQEETVLVGALSTEEPLKIASLSKKSDFSLERILAVATQLELKGLVSILPGSRVALK